MHSLQQYISNTHTREHTRRATEKKQQPFGNNSVWTTNENSKIP